MNKLITLGLAALLILGLLFCAGCATEDTSEDKEEESLDDEDTGISDVFEDDEDLDAPQLPS